jgi:hypothetical protein
MKHLDRSKTLAVGLSLALVILPACSLTGSSKQPVTISATDPAAEIYVDGNLIGTGVVTVDLEKKKTHAVLARVEDRVGSITIGRRLSQTGLLDIIGGVIFLVPFIGVFGDSFWELDSDNVTVIVPPARQ